MALKRTLTGVGPAVALNIADEDLSSAELRLRLQDWAVGDTISVWWDETQLIDPDVRYCQAGNPHGISSESPPKKEIGRKSLKSLDVSHCFFVRPTLRFPRFWVQNDFSE